jgi:hypothetical protein
MTQHKRNAIIGSVFLVIVVGIPLAFIFGPLALIVMASGILLSLLKKEEKHIAPKKVGRKLDNELITVVLPTINSKV